jgi:hypothetical protein
MKIFVLALLVALGIEERVEVVETLGAPVTIESAAMALDKNSMSIIRVQARAVSAPVSVWTLRVKVLDPDTGKLKGILSSVMGQVGLDAQTFDMSLIRESSPYTEGDRLQVTVAGRRARTETETPPIITNELACEPGFCAQERVACYLGCGNRCVQRFMCKQGRESCESDCTCKSTPGC